MRGKGKKNKKRLGISSLHVRSDVSGLDFIHFLPMIRITMD